MGLVPCPGIPSLVLEVNGVGSHPYHKCSGSQPLPLLLCGVVKRICAWRGDMPLRECMDKGRDLGMEEVPVL